MCKQTSHGMPPPKKKICIYTYTLIINLWIYVYVTKKTFGPKKSPTSCLGKARRRSQSTVWAKVAVLPDLKDPPQADRSGDRQGCGPPS